MRRKPLGVWSRAPYRIIYVNSLSPQNIGSNSFLEFSVQLCQYMFAVSTYMAKMYRKY